MRAKNILEKKQTGEKTNIRKKNMMEKEKTCG